MAFRAIVLSLFLCCIPLLYLLYAEDNGDKEDKVLYEKAQKLVDGYTGRRSLLRKAERLIDEIASNDPNSKYALVGYGRITVKSGYISNSKYRKNYLSEAKAYYDKAISIDPDFFDAYFYSTYLYIFSGDFPMAKEMTENAQRIAPDSAKTDLLLSEISENEKRYDDVIKYAKSAIEKKPDNKILVDAHSQLCEGYKKLKQYELADKAYREIINIEPESPWARSNYSGFLSHYLKDYDEAIKQGEMALELMNFAVGRRTLARAYYGKGAELSWTKKNYKESIKYFTLATEYNPSMSRAWYGLGISTYIIGHRSQNAAQIYEARDYLERAVKEDPNNQKAIKYLSNARKLIAWLEQQN